LKNKHLLSGIIFAGLYAFLILFPVIILLLGPKSSGRPGLLDLSVSLAFVGLAIMALQFVNSGRLKFFNAPFGTDLVYHFHRQIGIAAFFLVFAHPTLLFILDSRYLRYLNIFTSPLPVKFGSLAILFLVLVVWLAEYRQKLKIPYWFWKFWHGILATVMVSLALIHIFLTGNYVSQAWKKELWIGYSVLFIGMLIYTRVIYPLRLTRNPFTVTEVKNERGDVWTISLKPPAGKEIHFQPGQFGWLTAWKSPFSDSEHPFSLVSSAEKTASLQMSIKNLGPFTKTIQKLQSGDKVYLDGPYGYFSTDRYPDAKKLVLIPGGIGVTPIMSILRTLADRGDQRPLKVFYANQTWDAVTFREEMEELRQRLNMELVYVIERPPDDWQGESGFLNNAVLKKYLPDDWLGDDTEVFLCGPTPMMNAVEKALHQTGYAERKVHTERYSFV
jgi:predicted ferric reductase